MTDIKTVEVGPRDGLQHESIRLRVQDKVALISKLLAAGASEVEVGSFVSAKAVPAMADTAEVCSQLEHTDVPRWALVPNEKGFERAQAAGISHMAIFLSASEGFSHANLRQSLTDARASARTVIARARAEDCHVRGYLSCIATCPYEGAIPVSQVVEQACALQALGCEALSLGDTTGMATPKRIKALLAALSHHMDVSTLALHCHDTYGQALANVAAGIEMGVRTVDTSIAGMGGCPYAPGASGNLATEDFLYFCQGQGLKTSMDLNACVEISKWLQSSFGIASRSRAGMAFTAKDAAR